MLEEETEEFDEEKSEVEEDEFILEGKRWAEGGYAYGFDFASVSSIFSKQRSRKNLRIPKDGGGGANAKKLSAQASKDSVGSAKSSTATAITVQEAFEEADLTTGTLCPVSEDAVAIHNRTHIKFVFLRTGKSRLLVPGEHRGVGAIGGRDDISVLAWSDIGPPAPKIHVYKYADPQNIIDLEGKKILQSSKSSR